MIYTEPVSRRTTSALNCRFTRAEKSGLASDRSPVSLLHMRCRSRVAVERLRAPAPVSRFRHPLIVSGLRSGTVGWRTTTMPENFRSLTIARAVSAMVTSGPARSALRRCTLIPRDSAQPKISASSEETTSWSNTAARTAVSKVRASRCLPAIPRRFLRITPRLPPRAGMIPRTLGRASESDIVKTLGPEIALATEM